MGIAAGVLALGVLVLVVQSTVRAASQRLTAPVAEKGKVAVAANAEEAYCTPRFKEVLERVLHSCGLSEGEARRGCKPADVKTFASISGQDFNELFTPLKQRGAVILFDTGKEDLDAAAQKMLEDRWLDRKGARYFFVVGRASKTGSVETNRALSHRRANSIQFHLKEKFADSELDKRVGLLWLGNEFAQLDKDFCVWQTSRTGEKCDEESINRSAFVSWVDCRL
jgi:outer membrane protein OmpA-like peptidoglycan-associated protein